MQNFTSLEQLREALPQNLHTITPEMAAAITASRMGVLYVCPDDENWYHVGLNVTSRDSDYVSDGDILYYGPDGLIPDECGNSCENHDRLVADAAQVDVEYEEDESDEDDEEFDENAPSGVWKLSTDGAHLKTHHHNSDGYVVSEALLIHYGAASAQRPASSQSSEVSTGNPVRDMFRDLLVREYNPSVSNGGLRYVTADVDELAGLLARFVAEKTV